MTNAELIAKIKAEIERLLNEAPTCDDTIAYLMKVECFLDTLESEKPMNLEEELNEEIKKEMVKLPFFIRGKDQIAFARHFAEWGYLRAAEKYDEIEYNRQRAEESVPTELNEAAEAFAFKSFDEVILYGCTLSGRRACFIAGAKWQKGQDEEEQADLFTIVALDAAQRAKEQMIKDIPKWHKVQRGSCFDKHTNFLLSAREGHFYCSSIEVPRDGYILLVDELERLPKEDEK